MANTAKYEGKDKGELRNLLGRRDGEVADLNAEIEAMLEGEPLERGVRLLTTSVGAFLSGFVYGKKPEWERWGDVLLALGGGVGAFVLASSEEGADTIGPNVLEGVSNIGIVPQLRALGRKVA